MNFVDYLHHFLFGIYPYIALAVFLAGSLIRFDREQYTWKTDSSQLLRRGQLRLGSNLFHIGILGLFLGHLFGLLTPAVVYHAVGLSTAAKQTVAVIVGDILGVTCLAGLLLLVYRRTAEPRLRRNSRGMDFVVLFWILIALVLGILTTPVSWQHREGGTMLALASWAQHIVTFRGGAAELVRDVDLVYKIHLFFGMTVFVLFPFSRLVHVWSGFGIAGYLLRPYQIVRRRG